MENIAQRVTYYGNYSTKCEYILENIIQRVAIIEGIIQRVTIMENIIGTVMETTVQRMTVFWKIY